MQLELERARAGGGAAAVALHPGPGAADDRGRRGIGALMARPRLLQLRVDPGLGVLFPLSAAAMAGGVAVGLILLARRPPAHRPRGLCAMYLMGLFFSLPVFVFASPYAAVGGMTIAFVGSHAGWRNLTTNGGRVADPSLS